MKNLLFLFCLIFLPVGCHNSCRSCLSDNSSAERLRIGTNSNFPPYETIDDGGELVGFDIDVGKELAKALGLKAEFKEFDFDALILALKKEQVDILLSGMSITDSRQQEIAMVPYAGEPMTTISLLFWQKLPEDIRSLSDLKTYMADSGSAISVQAGHFLEQFLRDEGMLVKTLAGPPEQILDIKYGKSFAAALDGPNAINLSNDHPNLKLLTLDLPKDKWDLGYGIGIKKTRADLIEKIRMAVLQLKTDGTIEKLKKRWFKDAQ